MAQEPPAQSEMPGEPHEDWLSMLPQDLIQENNVFKEIQNDNPETRNTFLENPYPCRICQKSFRHLSSLRCHLIIAHPGSQQEIGNKESENCTEGASCFTCELCDLVFESELQIQCHWKVHRKGGLYCCTECGQSFKRFRRLEYHLRWHKGKLPIISTKSAPGSVNVTGTSFQILIQDHKIPFICTECGECFISYKKVLKHQKIHTAFKLVKKLQSGKSGTLGAEDSINGETRATNQSIACTRCGEVFVEKEDLLAHQETHTRDDNDIQKEHLAFQQSVRKSERQQKSRRECEGSFIETETLVNDPSLQAGQKHQEESCTINKGEQLFSCKHCSKIFRYKVNLLTHQKIHSKENSFACEVCGKRFIQKINLLCHRKTHIGEKRHTCSKCCMSFNKITLLKKHEKRHVEGKHFTCIGCGRIFMYQKSFLNHQIAYVRGGLYLCTKDREENESMTDTVCDQRLLDLEKLKEMLKEGQCRGCGRKFTYSKSFLNHLKAYLRKGSYMCVEYKPDAVPFTLTESNQSIPPKMDFEKHQEQLEEEQPCSGCGKTFTDQESFLKHQKAFLREGLYLCDENSMENEHLTNSQGDQSFTELEKPQEKQEEQKRICSGCGRNFTYKKSFLKHQKAYLREGLYLCTKNRMDNKPLTDSESGQSFPDLEKPQEKEEGQNVFTCRGCGRIFTHQKMFLKHQKVYVREGLYLCTRNEMHNKPLTDSVHDQSFMDLEEKPQEKQEGENRICSGCGRKFTYQKSFLKHQKVYVREGLYLCTKNGMDNKPLTDSEGDQSFLDLERPQQRKNRKCRGCGRKFKYQKSFLKHQKFYARKGLYLCSKIEMDDKPLTDSEGDRSFTDLEKPQAKQEGQNRICSGCGRRFTYQKSFLKHQKVYLREGLYLCSNGKLTFD